MIKKTEIELKAKEFEIPEASVERDYIFGWLLFGMFTESKYKEDLFLKGGNALRKGYFENTRYSDDLDFGFPTDINEDEFLNEVNRICDFIQEKTGVSFLNDENFIKEKFQASTTPLPDLKVYEVRVYFKDFYGKSDHMKIRVTMDVTRFDKVLLPIQTMSLIHPYSDSMDVACEIRCMKLEEIIATKLKCLLQRRYAPDLFDYIYSIELLGGSLDKDEVVKTFIDKTIFGNSPHVVKDILEKSSFGSFKKYWKKSVICAKAHLFNIEHALDSFKESLDSLFENIPPSRPNEYEYFKAEHRSVIMEAGRSQTLLKICYKNEERIVEPYALKYQKARNGMWKEYLMVYQVEGLSGQGIRRLQPSNMQSIENTEDAFEPRYQIELSKAGELPENPYLFDPNKPMRNPRRARSRIRRRFSYGLRPSGPRYIYQCSYCGKKFTRTKQNDKMNKHKDKFGYPCPGNVGYYVDTKY